MGGKRGGATTMAGGPLTLHIFECHITSEGKKYTPKVFSARKTQVPQQAKKRFGVYQKACFQGKKKEIHIH